MKIAKVVGTLVSPVSHPLFEGQRLLVCDLVDPDGSVDGSLIAVDVVNAGVGERVLICDEILVQLVTSGIFVPDALSVFETFEWLGAA